MVAQKIFPLTSTGYRFLELFLKSKDCWLTVIQRLDSNSELNVLKHGVTRRSTISHERQKSAHSSRNRQIFILKAVPKSDIPAHISIW